MLLKTFGAAALMISLAVGGAVVVSSPASGVAGFGDVGESEFYTAAVQWMVDNNITNGTSANCFSPGSPVTRGQAAAFMWRMEGKPAAAPHSFTDVVALWQQGPVSWMAANNITTGTTLTTYSPDEVLTRGQLAALLWRLAGKPAASGHPFTDVTASWQQTPVAWMVSTSPVITTGTTATTFSPDDPVTRGQLATFFWRYKGKPAVTIDSSSPFCGSATAIATSTTTTTVAGPIPTPTTTTEAPAGGGDTTPPTLTSLSFNPLSLDVSSGSASVDISYTITDDLSGPERLYLAFRSPVGGQILSCAEFFPSTSPLTVTGTCTSVLGQFSETGEWSIFTAQIRDQAGNQQNLGEADLINLGLPTKLNVTSAGGG